MRAGLKRRHLLCLQLGCPRWRVEGAILQPPNSPKLPGLTEMKVAKAAQQRKLERRMGTRDHLTFNLQLLSRRVRELREQSWLESPLALLKKVLHFLVLRGHLLWVQGHRITQRARGKEIAFEGRTQLPTPG